VDIPEIEKMIAELEKRRDQGDPAARVETRDELFALRQHRRALLAKPEGTRKRSVADLVMPIGWSVAELHEQISDLNRWRKQRRITEAEWREAVDLLERDPEHPKHGVRSVADVAKANGYGVVDVLERGIGGHLFIFAKLRTKALYSHADEKGDHPGAEAVAGGAPVGFGRVQPGDLERLRASACVQCEIATPDGYAMQDVRHEDLFVRKQGHFLTGVLDVGMRWPGEGGAAEQPERPEGDDEVLIDATADEAPTPREWRANLRTRDRIIRGLVLELRAREPAMTNKALGQAVIDRVPTGSTDPKHLGAVIAKLVDVADPAAETRSSD